MADTLLEEPYSDFPEVAVRLIRVPDRRTLLPIKTMSDAVSYMASVLKLCTIENLAIILLDTKGKPLCHAFVSRGKLSCASYSLTEIIRIAVLSNAATIICLHNHPSGETIPSKEDDAAAQNMYHVLLYIGVPLLDFIIVGGEACYSYREQGHAPFEEAQCFDTSESETEV